METIYQVQFDLHGRVRLDPSAGEFRGSIPDALSGPTYLVVADFGDTDDELAFTQGNTLGCCETFSATQVTIPA